MTQKTSHTQRLLRIKELLAKQPYSIKQLKAQLNEEGITTGERQLYRNIKEIGVSLLNDGEQLTSPQKGKMMWMIEVEKSAPKLSTFDINSFIISQATNPSCLRGRQTSLDKINSHIGKIISKTDYNANPNWNRESIAATHFYEFDYKEAEHKDKIEDFLNCAADHFEIELLRYEGDSVSLYKSIKLPFTFYPIRIVYHRGIFFVLGVIKELDKVLALDIHQVEEFKIIEKSFRQNYRKLKNRLDMEMSVRFGITQNMNEQVFDIELEFSSITGFYVKNHIWHDSFSAEPLSNGNWLMKMKCGLNRELVGWIFQWMGNVKIINPPELKDLYLQQLQKMIKLNDGGDLEYSNIFQPK